MRGCCASKIEYLDRYDEHFEELRHEGEGLRFKSAAHSSCQAGHKMAGLLGDCRSPVDRVSNQTTVRSTKSLTVYVLTVQVSKASIPNELPGHLPACKL